MNLGDTFEKDYYFEFEPKKNYETGKVAHKLPQGTNEPLRFTIEEMYLLRQFFEEPQIRNPTKVSERCGPNRQECDFSSLD